jgi:hypothetical protein
VKILAAIHEIAGASRDQFWKTCFGIRWRDSNRFLREMVTTIHKPNTG